eukprot:692158-Prymnesium_polylepis.1
MNLLDFTQLHESAGPDACLCESADLACVWPALLCGQAASGVNSSRRDSRRRGSRTCTSCRVGSSTMQTRCASRVASSALCEKQVDIPPNQTFPSHPFTPHPCPGGRRRGETEGREREARREGGREGGNGWVQQTASERG